MLEKLRFRKGMSLFEVMVSVALLLTASCAALGSIVYCIVLTNTSADLTIAVSDAQFALEQVRGLAFSNIPAYSPPALTNLPSETIFFTTSSINPNLIKVTITVTWVEFGQSRSYAISTYFAS